MPTEVKAGGIDSTRRSDQQSNDRTGTRDRDTSGPIAGRDLADRESDMVHSIAETREAGVPVRDGAGEAGDSMQETRQNIAEKTKDTHQRICHFTRENPTAAVLMACALGAILIRILPGR